MYVQYSAKCWWDKTLVNRSFYSFGEEHFGEFTIATISYYSESGIWLGKILANDDCFTKFAKVSSAKVLCYMVCPCSMYVRVYVHMHACMHPYTIFYRLITSAQIVATLR